MVSWMESVERNRAELREANDMAFERIDARFGRVEALFREMESRLESKLDRRYADLIKWSFTFWVGSTLTLLALALAIVRQGR